MKCPISSKRRWSGSMSASARTRRIAAQLEPTLLDFAGSNPTKTERPSSSDRRSSGGTLIGSQAPDELVAAQVPTVADARKG